MNQSIIDHSTKIYTYLLRLYPTSFRKEFGSEMAFVFEQHVKDKCRLQGTTALIEIWARTIIDLIQTLPTSHLENKVQEKSMQKNTSFNWNQGLLQSSLGTAIILMIPFLGMQFAGVDWTRSDFVIAAIGLFSTGILLQVLSHKVPSRYRLWALLAVLGLFFWIWAELAVGVFTSIGS